MPTQAIPGKKYVANEIGFSGERWPQHPKEINAFLVLMQGARSYLEIGCFNGDTLHYIGSRMPKGSKIVGVDLPRKHPMYGAAEANLYRAAMDLERQGQKVHILVGDSHDRTIIRKVGKLQPFDVVLIDGDHSAAGVRADWKHYGWMGQLVGFHDAHKLENVAKYYKQLTFKHKHQLLIKDEEIGLGIGVIWNE